MNFLFFDEKHKGLALISLVFMLSIFSFSLASAAPPFQSFIPSSTGYQIEYPKIDTIKAGSDFHFNFHVFNATNGVPKSNLTTSCAFDLYDSSGEHIYTSRKIQYNTTLGEWEIEIDGNYFAGTGEYSALAFCNSTTQGGFISFPIIINSDGASVDNTVLTAMLFFIAFGILILGITTKNVPGTILGGFATMAMGIFSINSGIIGYRNQLTYIISILTIVIGGFWAVKAGLEQITDNM